MKPIPFLLSLAAAAATALADSPKIHRPGFRYEEIHSGNGMTALAFDSFGRMFVC